MRECGLKSCSSKSSYSASAVTPCAGVWIEILSEGHSIGQASQSLPVRECGLKYILAKICSCQRTVTPCAGVWIEIFKVKSWTFPTWSHSLCGSVDWNNTLFAKIQYIASHSLCGSVDWNKGIWEEIILEPGHSLCGSVDWNTYFHVFTSISNRHSLCGSVDWNLTIGTLYMSSSVTPCAGVWIEIRSETSCNYTRICHSLCGSVDWNTLPWAIALISMSLPVRECGLK